MVQALFQKFNILNLGAKPESLTKGGIRRGLWSASLFRGYLLHYLLSYIVLKVPLQRSAS